jgi:uncharacterized membrane protein YagU involved in acid resistance
MKTTTFSKINIISGILAGVIAGIAMGCMMIRMAVLSKVGMLMGMPNPLSGFLMHTLFSAVLGLIFAIVFVKITRTFFSSTMWGLIYGIIWWLLLPMTFVQMKMGMPVSWSIESMLHGMPMLVGHLVFGIILGMCYYGLKNSKLGYTKSQK